MKPTEHHVAILFADVCDSVPLYEASGDAGALRIIARRLDDLAVLAAHFDGRVIRSKGDDVLCVFEDAGKALGAAAAMLSAHGRGTAPIHVGLHAGTVISARGDIYGDAVNVAARLLGLAKAGEAVASRALVERLPQSDHARLTPIGSRVMKGKQEAIDVYSMVLDEGLPTQVLTTAAARPPATVRPALVVELRHDRQLVTLRAGDRCVVGRAERCDLRVDDPQVSREHAWIQVAPGSVTFLDQSSAGSWLLDGDGEHVVLRRESRRLEGEGIIRLSRSPHDPKPAPEIAFRVIRGA